MIKVEQSLQGFELPRIIQLILKMILLEIIVDELNSYNRAIDPIIKRRKSIY